MLLPPDPVEEVVVLSPARDARLLPYAFIGMGGLGGAVVAGQPYLAMLAAPFLVALVLGLRRHGSVRVRTQVCVDRDRIVEGDSFAANLKVEWDGAFDARLTLHRLTGVVPEAGSSTSAASRGVASLELPVRLKAA